MSWDSGYLRQGNIISYANRQLGWLCVCVVWDMSSVRSARFQNPKSDSQHLGSARDFKTKAYNGACVWCCCNSATLTTATIYASLESIENKLSFGILDSLYNAILHLQLVRATLSPLVSFRNREIAFASRTNMQIRRKLVLQSWVMQRIQTDKHTYIQAIALLGLSVLIESR